MIEVISLLILLGGSDSNGAAIGTGGAQRLDQHGGVYIHMLVIIAVVLALVLVLIYASAAGWLTAVAGIALLYGGGAGRNDDHPVAHHGAFFNEEIIPDLSFDDPAAALAYIAKQTTGQFDASSWTIAPAGTSVPRDAVYHGEITVAGAPCIIIHLNSAIDVSPPVVLDRIAVDGARGVIVVRDDLLPGGTKQRAAAVIGALAGAELVYAGPWNGFAQVALAIACKLHDKRATVFASRDDYWTSVRARMYGARIEVHGGPLKELQEAAAAYVDSSPDRALLPFGFDSPEIRAELVERLREATASANFGTADAPVDAGHYAGTVWLVAGSGTLVNVLYEVFPAARFTLVQVGKRIWPDQIQSSRTTLHVAPEGFYDDAAEPPPYPYAAKYDAKLWQFARRHAADGDVIWNVAGRAHTT